MNIVFDLGGVVVEWKPDAIVADVFADAGRRALARREIIGHADWLELDRGALSRDDAIARAAARTAIPEHDVARLFTRVPLSLVAIPGTVELLYRLKTRGHTLYCISNMQVASIEHLERSYQFFEVFSGAAISCRLHLCKPEPAIYAYLIDTFALNPADTVFIDDVDVNVTAARQSGMHGIRFESPEQCERDLKLLGAL